ncbi:MAG: PP2C family serine/threonine-protein phosphatase [Sulfitobacter sp.]
MSGDQWIVGSASVIGPAHIRRNMPNQDAVLVQPGNLAWAPVVVGAVSDGHGAAAHFRSDRGAQMAVQSAISALEWGTDDSEEIDLADLSLTLAEGWRQKVAEDIQRFPFEQKVAHPVHPYGATILAMLADREQVCLVQLGDGDILLGYADGRITRPIPAAEGLVGEQTYSLCQEKSEQYIDTWFAHRNWDEELPDFVLMATDGVSKSLVSEDAFMDLAAQYRARCGSGADVFAQTIQALPEWLENLTVRGSGDDASMVIAVRQTATGDE